MERENYWNSNFAYAVGLFTADGCLYQDGRHIEFCSKDIEQVKTFNNCIGAKHTITFKSRAKEKIKKYAHVQFSDVKLYKILQSIGLTPRKSLTIKKLLIPDEFFRDFTRGYLDGDGSVQANYHPEAKSLQLKIRFYSGSLDFLEWFDEKLRTFLDFEGGTLKRCIGAWWLVYSKRDALKIIDFIYYSKDVPCLERKAKVAYLLQEENKDFNPNRWHNRFTKNKI